jgi:hypothetical protein
LDLVVETRLVLNTVMGRDQDQVTRATITVGLDLGMVLDLGQAKVQGKDQVMDMDSTTEMGLDLGQGMVLDLAKDQDVIMAKFYEFTFYSPRIFS